MKLKRLFILISSSFFAFSILTYFVLAKNSRFSHSATLGICYRLKLLLSKVSSLIKAPIFEIIIVISPIIVFLLVKYVISKGGYTKEKFALILALLSLIPSVYVFTLGIPSKNERGVLQNVIYENPSEEEVILAANILIDRLNAISPSEKELNVGFDREIISSYSEIYSDTELDASRLPRPKKSIIGKILSYLGIHSLLAFPTGEIIINPNIPPHAVPFSLAHEYAHFIGEPTEALANFAAYLACINSKNEYIAYSGYVSGLEYFLADISANSPEMYTNIYNTIPNRVKSDIEAFRDYNRKYESHVIYKLADRLNSSYLNIVDSYGEGSYSLVTRYVTSITLLDKGS